MTITVGDQIEWINNDAKEHILVFRNERPPYEVLIGRIEPGKLISKSFDYLVSRIDYGCAIHPEENGTIIMYPKKDDLRLFKYSNTSEENITVNDEILPKPLHLDSELITLQRFLDPKLYGCLFNPEYYEIHNKIMTVVFWDLSGFSTLCNKLREEPATLMVFLKEYFIETIKQVHKFNGAVDKFMGDGVMAYFGFDGMSKRGADASVHTALELRKRFEPIRERWLTIWTKNFGHHNVSIDLKCGINTGDVLFGLLDMDSRYQLTSIGPTVNLASRLVGIAEKNEIIISQNTKDELKDNFNIRTKPLSHTIKSYPEIKFAYEIVE